MRTIFAHVAPIARRCCKTSRACGKKRAFLADRVRLKHHSRSEHCLRIPTQKFSSSLHYLSPSLFPFEQSLRPPLAACSPAFTRPRPRPCRRRRSARPLPSRRPARSVRPIIANPRHLRPIRAPRHSSLIRKAAVCRPFTRTGTANIRWRRRPTRRSTNRTAAALALALVARRWSGKWPPRVSGATALQNLCRRSTTRLAPRARRYFEANAGGCHSHVYLHGVKRASYLSTLLYRPGLPGLSTTSVSIASSFSRGASRCGRISHAIPVLLPPIRSRFVTVHRVDLARNQTMHCWSVHVF